VATKNDTAISTTLTDAIRSRGLVVITGNLHEFQRVDGLRCQDWLD
jgi:hypothetical protein